MHIECQQCAAKLSLELAWVDPVELNYKMGEELLRQGLMSREDGIVYVANPEDAIGMYLTTDGSRLNGCCGLDGRDGPNLLCENCKTYVATKMTDCWMSCCVAFDPKTTREVD